MRFQQIAVKRDQIDRLTFIIAKMSRFRHRGMNNRLQPRATHAVLTGPDVNGLRPCDYPATRFAVTYYGFAMDWTNKLGPKVRNLCRPLVRHGAELDPHF